MTAWLERWGARVILGADVRDGKVAVSGWLEDSGIGLDELIETFLPAGLKRAIVTDISRDGMLQGPSFDLYKGLQERFPDLTTIVSGGVSSLDDVRRAEEMGLPGIIVGKAIYENRIWCSLHSVIDAADLWTKVRQLKAIGAEGILVMDVDKIIL